MGRECRGGKKWGPPPPFLRRGRLAPARVPKVRELHPGGSAWACTSLRSPALPPDVLPPSAFSDAIFAHELDSTTAAEPHQLFEVRRPTALPQPILDPQVVRMCSILQQILLVVELFLAMSAGGKVGARRLRSRMRSSTSRRSTAGGPTRCDRSPSAAQPLPSPPTCPSARNARTCSIHSLIFPLRLQAMARRRSSR